MTDLRPKVLIIEDEPAIRRLIIASLDRNEYKSVEAENGAIGLQLAAQLNPSIIVLDLGLPEMQGTEVIQRVREWGRMPIIVLSARSDESDKIEALDLGANDYVMKPFSTAELLARIRASLRTYAASNMPVGTTTLIAQDIVINIQAHTVEKNGAQVHLTPTEFKLLYLLMKNADRVLTHRMLLKEVWGPSFGADVQYLRVFMKQLRGKIERTPSTPTLILTEAGIGYKLVSL